jgi:hypothetical protein
MDHTGDSPFSKQGRFCLTSNIKFTRFRFGTQSRRRRHIDHTGFYPFPAQKRLFLTSHIEIMDSDYVGTQSKRRKHMDIRAN